MYDFVSSDNIQETDVAILLQASVHKILVWIGTSWLTVVTEVTVLRLWLCGLWQCVVLEVDTHIFDDYTAFIFGDWIDMQMKAVISSETQLSTYSTACCRN
jgi:hypothetical protein